MSFTAGQSVIVICGADGDGTRLARVEKVFKTGRFTVTGFRDTQFRPDGTLAGEARRAHLWSSAETRIVPDDDADGRAALQRAGSIFRVGAIIQRLEHHRAWLRGGRRTPNISQIAILTQLSELSRNL
jgi:hypothetical protein